MRWQYKQVFLVSLISRKCRRRDGTLVQGRCLCDGKVLICGGGGVAYSREEDNSCKMYNFFSLLYRSGCVVVPLRSFPALELDTYFVDGALMDQIHKVTLCHTTQ